MVVNINCVSYWDFLGLGYREVRSTVFYPDDVRIIVLRNKNIPPPGYRYHNPKDHITNPHGMETSDLRHFIFCRSYVFGIALGWMDLLASLTLDMKG
jgi:hypothetical protein